MRPSAQVQLCRDIFGAILGADFARPENRPGLAVEGMSFFPKAVVLITAELTKK